ncbi:ABC transporter ATP-binding protein [Cohaesibacter gelatinilyticus]|uniref:Putative ABC transport system ATP-binding protein n=1 Tax=Cohaesibacter gelatinilyticus TaxID=372072 RepID=A0A285NHU3_9HYPH|nr:ABC transporter ATP-binding protein [Cohaesibacter gelatinilyticus]SNZ07231.1 putative ABC transport system ATP-binding protein [Cohaesibacter gelatinilyticus]
MIELYDIHKIYNQGQSNQVNAVRDVTITLDLNQTSVLKGPSGSGKTTLLSLIGCLSRPTSGRIMLNGEVISNLPEAYMSEIRRRTFGFIFQRFNLIRGLSVLENVMVPAYPSGGDHGALIVRGKELLSLLELGSKADMSVEALSGGESQRVAIARALINDPSIVIADEPTANLDTALSEQFLQIIGQLREAGKTIIMTSHDPRIWQAEIVDRVISMKDGGIEEDQINEAAHEHPWHEVIA